MCRAWPNRGLARQAVQRSGVLQQGGPQLFSGFHMAMAVAAVACVLATLAVFIIEPGPHVDFIPREFSVRNQQADKAGRKH